MAAQYNEMATKAKAIRDAMNAQLAVTAKFKDKTEAIKAGILPAVEAKINENSAKTAEISKSVANIQTQISMIAEENQTLQRETKPSSFLPVRRSTRII